MSEGSIKCIGKGGCSSTFYYKYSLNTLKQIEHRLTIFASNDYSDRDFFELIAKETDDKKLKIISINKNDDFLYGAKGIPDSAIPELIKLTGFGVISSSNIRTKETNEFRTEDATKFWDRLVKKGNATYDPAKDLYIYI